MTMEAVIQTTDVPCNSKSHKAPPLSNMRPELTVRYYSLGLVIQ